VRRGCKLLGKQDKEEVVFEEKVHVDISELGKNDVFSKKITFLETLTFLASSHNNDTLFESLNSQEKCI
jgi:hypothetical protein